MKNLFYIAAGGVVVYQSKVLILLRPSRNEVRLPKGHVEENETLAQAAHREVTEESGYSDLEILAPLGVQHLEFDLADQHVARDEHYFLITLKSEQQIERDPHEHQFIPTWMDWDEALSRLTYPIEREWLRRARASYEKTRGGMPN